MVQAVFVHRLGIWRGHDYRLVGATKKWKTSSGPGSGGYIKLPFGFIYTQIKNAKPHPFK
jgi:hypothetical protein